MSSMREMMRWRRWGMSSMRNMGSVRDIGGPEAQHCALKRKVWALKLKR